MKSPEVEVIESIKDKLSKKFPNIIEFAREEFIEIYKELLNNPHFGQFFYGWFFGSYCLYDGKTIPNFCLETLELNENEKILLNNIKDAIPGFFEVLYVKGKNVYLRDMLTKKEYEVKTIDLEPMPKKEDCLEAALIRNLEGDYFFFGGFFIKNEKEGIEWNLIEYSRDLTVDESTEREIRIISRMEEEQKEMLYSYLREVFGLNKIEIKQFLKLSEEKRKEFLKNIIKEMESE